MAGRRYHYHVKYDDGDDEDYDYAELEFAVELLQSLVNGTYVAEENGEEMSDGEGSIHIPSDNDENE